MSDPSGTYPPPYQNPYGSTYYEQGPEMKHSGFGIASAILACLASVGEIVTIGAAAVLIGQGAAEDSPAVIMVGLFILIGLLIAFVGAVLGIVGLTQGNRKKAWAIVGAAINGSIIMLVVGLIVIGMAFG